MFQIGRQSTEVRIGRDIIPVPVTSWGLAMFARVIVARAGRFYVRIAF